ncbi:uncharacterized protein [Paramormyrops kingsleyae]|uniref:uncharacterized protein n=1 Tax=Paramormyrops kingsleyae TaxID=1676925 RepID=UPI003B9790F9
MAPPVKLRIILGENNSHRLVLPGGIPGSVMELSEEIMSQCGLEEDFRLQFMDAEFGNEFMNLQSTSEIQDRGTIKVIFLKASTSSALSQLDGSPPPPFSAVGSSRCLDDSTSTSSSLCDTEILSSAESTSSSRSSVWPLSFPIPQFSYDAQLQLERANTAFGKNGALFNPDVKLKSTILDSLAQKIIEYKVYPSDADFENVAEALVSKHPCLREPGSVSGHSGWKASLKYKLGNYRSKLRQIGCPEVGINSLKRKPEGKCSPAYRVKKPKKAEVNFCPTYPLGETAETQEKIRISLVSEVKKRDSQDTVAMMMDKTFAHRRLEIVGDSPMIADIKMRWPALFQVREMATEFKRITTISLQSKFFSRLDLLSENLMKVYAQKGGILGRKIQRIMVPVTQNDSIDIKREFVLKGLCLYLNEDPDQLIREYMDTDRQSAERAMEDTVLAIFVIKHEGAEPGDDLVDVGIIAEEVEVLGHLGSVAFAVAMLLSVIYALNLSYPSELKYTFEALQKIFMELDGNKLSAKVQALKTKLFRGQLH